jgi:DNA-binding response OmpR family regulator
MTVNTNFSQAPRIAVVDDDPDVLMALQAMLQSVSEHVDAYSSASDFLVATGYTAATASSSHSQHTLASKTKCRYDLLICDWAMPRMDGVALVRHLRHGIKDSAFAVDNTPIIMLTSRFTEQEIVEALNAGADDFLVKPISAEILRARALAMLRRQRLSKLAPTPARIQRFGPYEFDTINNSVSIDGETIMLTHKEFALAQLFFTNPEKTFSRQMLADAVWKNNPVVSDTRTIDSHMHTLRKKLRMGSGLAIAQSAAAAPVAVIRRVYGVGYMLSFAGQTQLLAAG